MAEARQVKNRIVQAVLRECQKLKEKDDLTDELEHVRDIKNKKERLIKSVALASEASRRAEASLSSCAKPISAGYEAFSSLTNSGSICAGSSYCANMPFFLADVGADHHNSKSVSYDCFCVFFAGHFAGLA